MSVPIFETLKGLLTILPGARFKGKLVLNTEEEYNQIEWLDIREKPSWLEVEQAALTRLRNKIKDAINEKTSTTIFGGFRCSLSPETPIITTFEWQFDSLNLWLIRDTGLIKYPYDIHVGSNDQSIPQYITVNKPEDINTLYLEMFAFVSGWLASGRVEKAKLIGYTKTQLEEYRDLRE